MRGIRGQHTQEGLLRFVVALLLLERSSQLEEDRRLLGKRLERRPQHSSRLVEPISVDVEPCQPEVGGLVVTMIVQRLAHEGNTRIRVAGRLQHLGLQPDETDIIRESASRVLQVVERLGEPPSLQVRLPHVRIKRRIGSRQRTRLLEQRHRTVVPTQINLGECESGQQPDHLGVAGLPGTERLHDRGDDIDQSLRLPLTLKDLDQRVHSPYVVRFEFQQPSRRGLGCLEITELQLGTSQQVLNGRLLVILVDQRLELISRGWRSARQ